MRRLVLLLTLSAAVSACGAPRASVGPPGDAVADGGLALSTPASSYARGQPIPLVLRNTGEATYQGGVLDCAAVEQWVRHRWEPVATDRACIAMAVEVAPGGTLEAAVPLDLPAGAYRFTHTLTPTDDDDPVTVATRAFRLGTRRAPDAR